MFYLMPGLIDLAGDKFWKAPPEISIERLMPLVCWIRWDSVVCIPISGLGVTRSFTVCYHHGTCRYFNFYVEDSGGECHGG
jgi:hypothetical protein